MVAGKLADEYLVCERVCGEDVPVIGEDRIH